jgi:hypothetical protein
LAVANSFSLFGLAPEKPAMLGLFRDSFYGVPVHTTPDAECFFLDFGLGRSAEFESSVLIFSTGMYPLYPGVCSGVAGLAACVTIEGAKSACVNTLRSTGHSPLFLNPFITVCTVVALGNAMPTSDAICSVDSRYLGFSLSFVAIIDDMNVFNGLKNVRLHSMRAVGWQQQHYSAMFASNFNSSQALVVTAVPI